MNGKPPTPSKRNASFWKRFDTLVSALQLPVATPSSSSSSPTPLRHSIQQSSSSSSASSGEDDSQQSQNYYSQTPVLVTQIGYSNPCSYDYSPVPPPSISPARPENSGTSNDNGNGNGNSNGNSNSNSNGNGNSSKKRRQHEGTAEMYIAKKRLKTMGPLHITPTPTPNEAPPAECNDTNYLRHVLVQFADKIVSNNVVGTNDIDSKHKPAPNHFGVAERFIRAKIKVQLVPSS